ncbi:splicing factor ESS-2 homolog [Rhodnius prolixus]|uniref:splicing factor ESS-2 homolog n=1 Tax=Rhodnius prolixus TaxID=13249 RepID=UPI003D189F42
MNLLRKNTLLKIDNCSLKKRKVAGNKILAEQITKHRHKILDEDAYLNEMDKIIQRDFFPELEKLKAHNENLVAFNRNDTISLQQIQETNHAQTPAISCEMYSSPDTFETDQLQQVETFSLSDTNEGAEVTLNMSLDEYLSSHTSIDNQSYEESIAEADNHRHRQNYPWLYLEETIKKNYDSLSSVFEVNSLRSKQIDTWSYKDKNCLMFFPDGVELTLEERKELAKKYKTEINHSNTRFKIAPFVGNEVKKRLQKMAHIHPKIGVDGKVQPSEKCPKINDFSLLRTPSPVPGVNESPLMTWGQIESTPYKIDDSPLLHAQINYTLPEASKQENLAIKLSEEISRRHTHGRRSQSSSEVMVKSQRVSPSPGSSLHRFNMLSPAAKTLAVSTRFRNFGRDKRLASSYRAIQPSCSLHRPSCKK